jgi:hypothetical protein
LWTGRTTSTGIWFLLFFLLSQTSLLACPVCFQMEDGQAAAGVRAAVLVLAGVTTAVLAGFGVFIRRLVRRP